MAKEIKFNVKLTVDGKEQLVTATSTAEELRRVLGQAKTEAEKFDAVLVNFNQHIEALQSLNNAISQIVGTLNTVTEESRTFSAAMNAANTMAGKSGEDFAKLKGEVAELSKTLPIARDELANGLYQVISNGVPEDNWIDYLQKSAKASIGGIADLGETVKVTSTVIKNYGLSWDAAGDVQDKIQLTAKNGVTSFEQLAQALPRVTGNAATLGVSVDELMATFATLTGVSGNTAEVSTQLAAVFTALVKPTSEAGKMAQQMGIEFNAASIKSAGGMRNFLAELDTSVKAYASKSGMLEQEIYGKLFGSAESLRALGPLTGKLAAKFDENVEAMKGSAGTIDDAFATMSSSGAASLQMLKNKVAEVTDGIASAIGGVLPVLNITSQVGNSVVAILALNRALKTFGGIQSIAKARILATNAASLVWNATSVRMSALTQVMSASLRGAAVSAKTLKLAIQGLLISTGVGAAIVGLTEIISAFVSKSADAKAQSEDAAESMRGMGDVADEVKTAYDSTLKGTYADLMAKYEVLKAGWRALSTEQQKMAWIRDNQSAFNELRIKIGDVADAESIFSGNTDAVVKAFEKRAQAAAYAAKLAELYKKQLELKSRVKDVDKAAFDATNAYNHGKGVDNTDNPYAKQNAERAANLAAIGADMKRGGDGNVSELRQNLNNVNNEIAETKEGLKSLAEYNGKDWITSGKSAPNLTPAKGTPKKTTVTPDKAEAPKTYVEQLREQLSAAQKEMDNALTVEAKVEASAKVADIQAQIDEATKGKVSIEAETEPTYIVRGSAADKRQSRSNAGQRISRIQQDYEIGLIGKDEAERQIADLNRQLEGLGVKPIEVHFKTHAEELQEQLRSAQREFDEAATVEAKVKASAKVVDIQAQIDKATKGKVSIEADVEPAYIVQGSTADRRQSYGNAQSKANRIQQDFEIGLIGKDEAQKEIADINKQLSELGLKPIKIELDSKGFDEVFGNIKSGWGSIQGIGNGIQGITDALEGNGDAWQQVTGVINGFLSIVEGIQGVVQLFNLLTAATTAHSAASTVDAAATTADAAAATAATAAKSGEAVADATASGAKMPFPLNLVAIAAGVAAVIAALAAVSGFATGGVIGGTSTSGDKKFVRVNSGEMILNKFQQARLFGMVNGSFQPPTFAERELQPVTVQNIMSLVEPAMQRVEVVGRISGRDLVLVQDKERNRKNRS